MRYLFVIQGEGRGHMTQALSLAGILRRNGDEVVEVMVGKCTNRELPTFFAEKIEAPITRYDSPALDYGRKGKKGKMLKSIMRNSNPLLTPKWLKSMNLIARRIELTKPDVVINFYELLMGVTTLFHPIEPPIVSIAHQFLMGHPDYKIKASSNRAHWMLSTMNMFCSMNSKKILALSLYPMRKCKREKMVVVPPILRQEIFDCVPTKGDFILGYMLNHTYLDEVLSWKEKNPDKRLHLFWDKPDAPEQEQIREGLWLHRINDQKFIEYMASSAGYVTTAGFESVCEALYLGKPVMMIPAHIEQEINAKDAQSVGAGIISKEFNIAKLSKYIPTHKRGNKEFRKWVESAEIRLLKELKNI